MAERKRKPATSHGLEYIKGYDKQNARYIRLKFNRKYDADVIEWFEHQSSMQGAVKELVREAIKRGK